MNSLSDLEDLVPTMVLSTAFQNYDQGLPRDFAMFRRNFLRLCDKAIYEYRAAKRGFDVSGSKVFRGISFTNHMENSINALRRCYRLFDRVKNQPMLSIDRNVRRSFQSRQTELLPLRDTIEHFEQRLVSDIGDGEPIFLRVTNDGAAFEIGSHRMAIDEFEMALRRLHSIGVLLLQIREEAS